MKRVPWPARGRLGLAAERLLEPSLALLLFGVVLAGQVQSPRVDLLAVLLDLLACVLAALGALRPKEGPIVYLAGLVCYLFVPRDWVTIGELSALVPVLGMGVRGQLVARRVLTPLYGLIVIYRSLPADGQLAWTYVVFWVMVLGSAWLIGDAFRRAHEAQARLLAAALTAQRVGIARDLHDSVAHDLSNLALHAQQALLLGSWSEQDVQHVADAARRCVDDMRQVMRLLREGEAQPANGDWVEPDLMTAVTTQAERLRSAGMSVHVSVEGDLAQLPAFVAHAACGIVVEACNNVLKHGDRSRPCGILVTLDRDFLELVVVNGVARPRGQAGPDRLGVIGMRERALAAGGRLDARQHEHKWTVSAELPLHVSAWSDRP